MVAGPIAYPFPIVGSPRSAGQGAWYTVSKDQAGVHLWNLPHEV